jgi:diaminohydroxyphosphoribosylaminopyrimidine deaminase/5-amino-6-(5-phosphoribosylamino)uracil reductase
MLDLAARLAMRAAGYVEPNPMVGAVIMRDGQVIGLGHHMKFGGLHAEREALADCRRRGNDPRGATVYVTLEPCRHTGKQPPCTEALVGAGVARVFCARPDPGSESGGGASVLASAGIPCEFTDESPLATRLSGPFVKRVTTGLPWVIAKWAQTIDGKIATRDGESQWITGPLMRRRVHRLRARVDAVMVGAETVRTDNPMLTARDVRVRRLARRFIVSGRWHVGHELKIPATAREVPTTVVGLRRADAVGSIFRPLLERVGVDCMVAPGAAEGGGLDLKRLLALLVERYDITNILVEGGPTLLGSLIDHDLVDEAIVHVAPTLIGDQGALGAVSGAAKGKLAEARRLSLTRVKRLGDELELVYRRP